jgi:hypothetical protein
MPVNIGLRYLLHEQLSIGDDKVEMRYPVFN